MSDERHEDTPEQAEFRAYCRRWLAENRPPDPPFRLAQNAYEVMTEDQRQYLCVWQKKCYEAGLIACDFPREYGGGGHRGFQRVASSEIARAGAPYFINVIGLGMAAPTILHHGSEWQKRRFLPPLFSGEEIWCQGFSEPEAGSDLANVQAFAERRGDVWIINGHKVWTSLAHFASWMILLARTSRDDKYGGLTFFLVPIAGARGVTVRPLVKLTGETGFNEVLFEDLEIGDDLRVDAVGKGWTVAMTTLLHERGAADDAGRSGGPSPDAQLERLVRLAKRMKRDGVAAWDDEALRDRIVRLAIRSAGLRLSAKRARVEALVDHPMRLPLQSKLVLTELLQDLASTALEVEGMHAGLYLGDERAPDGAEWTLGYMNSFTGTIAGGSNEIQRNILGERVLGLPKSK